MNIKISKLIGAIFLLMASSLVTTSYAAPCGTSGGLDTADLTFRGSESDGCGGVFGGNDSLAEVNLPANNLLFGGTPWVNELKDDDPGGAPEGNASFLGIDWTLSADAGTSGNWTLAIQDPLPADLPVSVDLLAVLKAGPSWAAYILEDEIFSVEGSNSGTFSIAFSNPGGQIPDLSHLTLYARAGDPIAPPDPVPEPASILLMAIGLLGFAGRSRRQV